MPAVECALSVARLRRNTKNAEATKYFAIKKIFQKRIRKFFFYFCVKKYKNVDDKIRPGGKWDSFKEIEEATRVPSRPTAASSLSSLAKTQNLQQRYHRRVAVLLLLPVRLYRHFFARFLLVFSNGEPSARAKLFRSFVASTSTSSLIDIEMYFLRNS